MPDDRTIAPGPSRWRRAWAAGLRPRSAWLVPAVACGVLAMLVDELGSSGTAAWIDLRPGALAPELWLSTVTGLLALVLVAAGVLVVMVALASRQLGFVSAIEEQRLRAAPPRAAILMRLLLCVAVGVGVVLALDGGIAGSARSVDASEAGLRVLWIAWLGRAAAALSLGLGLGALVELWLDGRERGARLWQSHAQARDEARAAGGRSR